MAFWPWTQSRLDIQANLDRIYALGLTVTALEEASRGEVTPQQLEALAAECRANSAQIALLGVKLDSCRSEVDHFHDRDKNFAVAIADGIERVDRTERRIKSTVERAQKKLRDAGLHHDGLEEEARNIQSDNGATSPTGQLPAVSTEVAVVEEEASSIKGVPMSVVRRVRGF